MRPHLSILLVVALVVAGLAALMERTASAIPDQTGSSESLRLIRPGILYSATKVAAGATTATVAASLGTDELIKVVCTVDAWIDQGSSTVTSVADEHYLVAFQDYYLRTKPSYDYLSALRVGGVSGVCYISVIR